MTGDYYNRHISAWEPVLEPWRWVSLVGGGRGGGHPWRWVSIGRGGGTHGGGSLFVGGVWHPWRWVSVRAPRGGASMEYLRW